MKIAGTDPRVSLWDVLQLLLKSQEESSKSQDELTVTVVRREPNQLLM